jgi:hypothetical protein
MHLHLQTQALGLGQKDSGRRAYAAANRRTEIKARKRRKRRRREENVVGRVLGEETEREERRKRERC